MASEAKPATLNASQTRAVGAALRLVEETLDEIEQVLAKPDSGVTFRLAQDLEPEERRAILGGCDRLRAVLLEASRRLNIDAAERSPRREIRGKLSILWAILEDSKSAALRGYGPLAPEAGALVDKLLGEMSTTVLGILRLLAGARPEVAHRG